MEGSNGFASFGSAIVPGGYFDISGLFHGRTWAHTEKDIEEGLEIAHILCRI